MWFKPFVLKCDEEREVNIDMKTRLYTHILIQMKRMWTMPDLNF